MQSEDSFLIFTLQGGFATTVGFVGRGILNEMIAAIAVFVLASTGSAKLPTYEDVQKGMYGAYRKLKNYSDEWEMVISAAGQSDTRFVGKRKIDGGRFCFVASMNGVQAATNAHNGSMATMVFDSQKVFAQGPASNELFTQSWADGKPGRLERPGYRFIIQEYDIQCVAEPAFEVKSLEAVTVDKIPLRMLVAESISPSTNGRLKITMWFDKDRWILREFKSEGKSDVAGVSSSHGIRKFVNEKAKFSAADFLPDVSVYKDYERVSIRDMRGG